MLKFATARIIGAELGDPKHTKQAHRAQFQYTARAGYLYVRSRAISSRCNDNWDEFPADEIEKAYKTFVGKPVFVNHVNDNHRRARGVIIDAALHRDRNADGSPDTWVEVLMEVDAVRFPKLARAILDGHVDRTSMGCDVERSVCSACGNEATTPAEYCRHIPSMKGQRLYRRTASGQRVSELIRETCYGLGFFENSLLVEPPADPTAHFLGVDSSGLGKAASAQQQSTEQLGLFDRPAQHQLDLYHHTSGDNAASIMRTRGFQPGANDDPENAGRVYFSNRPHQEAGDHGDVAVHVRVPAGIAQAEGSPFSSGEQFYTVDPSHMGPEHLVGFRYPQRAASKISRSDLQRRRANAIASRNALRATAYGEVKAPADVDTLREEDCPVCGDRETYDGQACNVCGFISPPQQFRDPDLDMAKSLDLRKQVVDPSMIDDNGDLQRVDGQNPMPGQDGVDGAEQDPAAMADPDQLDENGLVASPYGDQALDGTQQGPAVSDRNGDGMIQPDEIDPEGNVNAQQMMDPEMGGQPGPQELPYDAQDRTGQPFTPGPDMPERPGEPEGPDQLLDQDQAEAPAVGQPGDGIGDLLCPSCGFTADATPPQTQNMADPMASSDGVVAGDVCPNCQASQLLTPAELQGADSVPPPTQPRM